MGESPGRALAMTRTPESTSDEEKWKGLGLISFGRTDRPWKQTRNCQVRESLPPKGRESPALSVHDI